MRFKRAFTLLLADTMAVVGLLLSAGTAGAAERDGVVEVGEFGLYYAPNSGLPVYDLYLSDPDFRGDRFPGSNLLVDNNTASYWNRDSFWWHVYTGYNYTGSHGCLSSGYRGNASVTFRNTISSARWLTTGC